MTIKKQFTILSLFIICIPIACAIYMRFEAYIQNTKRFAIDGTEPLVQFDSNKISRKDVKILYQTLRLLPKDVQCILIDDTNEILFSSISELNVGSIIPPQKLWDFMDATSKEYLYQFSAPQLDNNTTILITRTPKQKHEPFKKKNLFLTILVLLSIFVVICIILVLFISKTIFTSIVKIENKTKQLAEGNLSEAVITENDNAKRNEITSILEGLEKMRLSIIEVMNRKNKFIMGISHDLRTPVAIIKGYSEAITDGVISTPEDMIQSVQLIQDKTTRLGEMIDSLINYMKLNETEMREQLTPGPICKIINDFTKSSILSATVFKRNITSNIELPEEIYVPLNQQLVIRSFENLFSNALRYTTDGDTIKIISYYQDSNIYLKIEDSGIGIDEKDLANIFDMFYRGTNSRREEGMGIGLAVVKNIIDIHGWDISVTSKKDEGTCFTITIPVKAIPEEKN